MRSVTVVGASLAGHATLRALRAEGYAGRVVVVGAEPHRPYDRPPLSKDFLTGRVDETALTLESADDELDAEWLLGRAAVALDPASRAVTLSDGTVVAGDAVVVATGSRARTLPGPSLGGVHTVRTLDDALRLRRELTSAARLVVIGAGFVGSEVAAAARHLGLEVTVVEAAAQPLAGPLGPVAGAAVAALHERRGTRLLTGTSVRGLLGTDRVTGVELDDGRVLPTDAVVVGVGSLPDVEWLDGSGVLVAGGLRCDSHGRTAVEGVYAVGDCSAWWDPALGRHHRVEHWTDSHDRPRRTARALLGLDPVAAALPAPYFWSDLYGVRVQYAGRRTGDERFTVEAGSAQTEDLLGVFWRGDDPVAVVGMDQPRELGRWRRRLVAPTLDREVVTA